jgi:hypothetical protein
MRRTLREELDRFKVAYHTGLESRIEPISREAVDEGIRLLRRAAEADAKLAEAEKRIGELEGEVGRLKAGNPDDLRAAGWCVAVHNDYRLAGIPHTFWLFVNDGAAVKGEGESDFQALNQVRAALASRPGKGEAETAGST